MTDYFMIACGEAEAGMQGGLYGPFGAVVVKDGEVVGKGNNQVVATHDSTAHAEVVALRRAELTLGTHDLTGCEIYTTCYPCPMCLGAIMWARISTVHYGCTSDEAAAIGFDDREFYQALVHPDKNHLVQLHQHDVPECRSLFKKWINLENRQMY